MKLSREQIQERINFCRNCPSVVNSTASCGISSSPLEDMVTFGAVACPLDNWSAQDSSFSNEANDLVFEFKDDILNS
jgi:hypothetical protein